MYDKVCKSCGWSLSRFYSTGMLGCENCYSAFEKEITVALNKIQGKSFHVGKTPKLAEADKQLLSKYKELINEKEKATIEGRFSDIRGLTTQILSLTEKLKERGII